jgi:hypothetical protein
MSYARWSSDSDVYVYDTPCGWFECECDPRFSSKSAIEMIAHLGRHIAAGDLVPLHTLESLADEARWAPSIARWWRRKTAK